MVQSHWDIENGLHGVLDVMYGEDESRVRAFGSEHHGRRTPPTNLTSPVSRSGSVGPTARSQKGREPMPHP